MNVPVARPQVAAFVAAVRTQLDDLSSEEVDELTDGLEADLADALADSGVSPSEQHGDPAAYAAELRSAAGLPPRAVSGGERRGAVARARQGADDLVAAVRSHRWWPGARDFAITLRPAWWVLRALVASAGLAVFFGLYSLILTFAMIVASVELGRRRLADRAPAWRSLIAIGNAVALFGAFLVLVTSGARGDGLTRVLPGRGSIVQEVQVAPSNGVWVDGTEVRNLFPYDGEGHPLTGVQLYDENGRPVSVGDSAREALPDQEGRMIAQVPAVDAAGVQRWNVYPLRQRVDLGADGSTPAAESPSPASLPAVTPGALLVPTAAPATSLPGASSGGAVASPTAGTSASPTGSSAVPPTGSASPHAG